MIQVPRLNRVHAGGAVDFSPISNAISENRLMGFREKQFDANQAHRQETLGMQKERLGMQREQFETKQSSAEVEKAAGLAQMILQNPDQQAASQQWQSLLASNPQYQEGVRELGLDPADYRSGAQALIAEARGYQDPMQRKMQEAKLGLVQAQTDRARRDPVTPVSGTERIINKLMKDDPNLSYAEAVTLAKRGAGVTYKGDTGFDRFGNPIANIGDAISRGKKQETIGKARGDATAVLPKEIGTADEMLTALNDLKKDPYLPKMTGAFQGRLPNMTGDASRVQSRMDRITGASFLQAFQMLKGGGHITEIEGKKATDAITRLQTVSMNDEDYVTAIDELEGIVTRARSRAIAATGPGASTETRVQNRQIFDVGDNFSVEIEP